MTQPDRASAADRARVPGKTKRHPISGGFDRHDGHPAGDIDRAEHRQCAPVAGRHSLIDALAAHGPAITPGHLSGDAAFVDKDEPLRVDLFGFFPPEFSLGFDPLAVLFGGAERLFLKRSPMRFRITHSCECLI